MLNESWPMKQVTEIKSQNGKERKEIIFLVISEYTRLKQTSTGEQIKPDDSHLELEWVWWTIICCEIELYHEEKTSSGWRRWDWTSGHLW